MTEQRKSNRISVMLSDDDLKRLDHWGRSENISTRSSAIRRIVQSALAAADLRRASENERLNLLRNAFWR